VPPRRSPRVERPAACSARPTTPAFRGRSNDRGAAWPRPVAVARATTRSPRSSRRATRTWPVASRMMRPAAARSSSRSPASTVSRLSRSSRSRSRRCRSAASGSARPAPSRSPRSPFARALGPPAARSNAPSAASIGPVPFTRPSVGCDGSPGLRRGAPAPWPAGSVGSFSACARNRCRSPSR
jgi:hypothetical protein